MLAATRPMRRSPARSAQRNRSALSFGARRVGAFVLAHPGSVALVLLFGGLGAAVSVNALWMQSERHPAPLFRQAALQQAHSAPAAAKRAPEAQAAPVSAPAALMPEEASPAILPPVRPAAFGRSPEAGPAPVAKAAPPKHQAKDPIADLLGGPAPVPPAPIKSPGGKPQAIEKSAHPAAQSPANDAIAGLIDQSAHNR
ncbi:hypothetical protein SAMN05444161_5261 [Rhizobiales bacterium GAS191]|nr:hypothetical protein SAMN05519103_04524 [Rhizobiales bacterium GAS113]SEE25940.1 hypothetical protein SAMN05444161_5261 [Rhizobiales bacterium GAS191]